MKNNLANSKGGGTKRSVKCRWTLFGPKYDNDSEENKIKIPKLIIIPFFRIWQNPGVPFSEFGEIQGAPWSLDWLVVQTIQFPFLSAMQKFV